MIPIFIVLVGFMMIIVFLGIIQCSFRSNSNVGEDMILKSPIQLNNEEHSKAVIINLNSNRNQSKLTGNLQKKAKTTNIVYEHYIPKSILANLQEAEKIELASMAILAAPNEVQLMDQASFEPKFSHLMSACSNMGPSYNISMNKRPSMETVQTKKMKRTKNSDDSLVQSSLSTKSRTLMATRKAKERSKIQNYSSQQTDQNDDCDDDNSRSIGIPRKIQDPPDYYQQEMSGADDGFKSKIASFINNNSRHHSRAPTSGIAYKPFQLLSNTSNNNDSNIE
ncbi:uncharacterized protein LOC124492080 [Dermatophagoides farinae]|uniref:uncharacterized protein LOC124492080 n=1 Tax=Dermatophagoides farinae TaxID=6954 RepID=UPI003F5FA37E